MNCTKPSVCDQIKKNCKEFESTQKVGVVMGYAVIQTCATKVGYVLSNIPILLFVPTRAGFIEDQTSGFR